MQQNTLIPNVLTATL